MTGKVLDQKLIPILEEKYGKYWWPVEYPKDVFSDPFKNLIITVLSQNTSEINCVRAYEGLAAKFEVKPEILAEADLNQIKEAIRSGGLYNVKSKRIKELAKAVLEKFNGDLNFVLALPKEEAKKKLMELPGVGEKTADVLLSSRHGYHEVFVVDTHIDRIAKRLGLVEKTRNTLKSKRPLNISFQRMKEQVDCFGFSQNTHVERRIQNAKNVHS
jgi:endonuclease-3